MNANYAQGFFSFQPFWEIIIEETALIGPAGRPVSLLFHSSSDTGLWDTIPGVGNIILEFVLDEKNPQTLCSGLFRCRRVGFPSSVTDETGRHHYLHLRLVPGLFSSLFRENASVLNDKIIPLDDILPNNRLAEQMLDAKTFEAQQAVAVRFLQQMERTLIGPKDEIARASHELLLSRKGNISVSELSQELCYSPRYLHTVMQECIGIGPKEQCKNIRMQNALRMLSCGSRLSVEQIAQDLGYYDAAHFVRAYSAFTGESPTAFRRRVPCKQKLLSNTIW